MSTLEQRAEMVGKAYKEADKYLEPHERIARARFHEVWEWMKEYDPKNYQKVLDEFPDGLAADRKFQETVHNLLLTGKFGQVDWQV